MNLRWNRETVSNLIITNSHFFHFFYIISHRVNLHLVVVNVRSTHTFAVSFVQISKYAHSRIIILKTSVKTVLEWKIIGISSLKVFECFAKHWNCSPSITISTNVSNVTNLKRSQTSQIYWYSNGMCPPQLVSRFILLAVNQSIWWYDDINSITDFFSCVVD